MAKYELTEGMFYFEIDLFGQGRPSPLRQWCIFPSVSDFPLFPINFSDSAENFPNLTFSPKMFRFSTAKISDDLFLVIHHKFQISHPIYPLSIHFPPISGNFVPLLLPNFYPWFREIYVFLHTLRVFVSPTFTMMHLCITQCTYWTPLFSEKRSHNIRFTVETGKDRQNMARWLKEKVIRNFDVKKLWKVFL